MTKKTARADGGRTKGRTIEVAGLDGDLVRLTAEQLDELDSQVECPLLRRGEAGWDDAVLVWNGMVAKAPALVLQPTSAAHVATAVGFAGDHGLLLSIKGGGHNMAGTAIAERGLTLDMSRMREVTVDPDRRLAQVGPGVCSETSTGRRRRTDWPRRWAPSRPTSASPA